MEIRDNGSRDIAKTRLLNTSGNILGTKTKGYQSLSTIICITGMHRSGTSLVTSWLESSGLVIHDGSFLGPSVGNERGNFEDKEFVDIHAKELKSRFPGSKGWQVFTYDRLSFSSEHRIRLERQVNNRSARFPTWGWKDPRTVFFLDHWKEIIPDLKVLCLWRPCGQVVRSLVERSAKAKFDVFKVGKEESVLMWLSYNTHVLNYVRKHPEDAVLFNTHDIISDGHPPFKKINGLLENSLSHSEFTDVFDASLFGCESICDSDYSNHRESVQSLSADLLALSEK